MNGYQPACNPTAIQYVFRHVEKFEMIPAETRPRTSPNIRPDKVIDIALARRSAGARSAVQGMQICGVTFSESARMRTYVWGRRTVRRPTMKLSASSISTFRDRARPMLSVVVRNMRRRTSCRRLTRSPSGEMRRMPQP